MIFNTGMSSDEDLPRMSFGSFPSSQPERKCKSEPGQSTCGPSRSPPVRYLRLPTSNCGEPLSNGIGEPGHSSGTCRSPTLRDPRLPIRSGLSTNAVNWTSNQQGGRKMSTCSGSGGPIRRVRSAKQQEKSRGQSIYDVASSTILIVIVNAHACSSMYGYCYMQYVEILVWIAFKIL